MTSEIGSYSAEACRADIPVCRFTGLSSSPRHPMSGCVFRNWRLESRQNRQAGKPALHAPATRAGAVSFVFFLVLTAVALFGFGCRRDMFEQPSEKPLAQSELFRDNEMASRPVVPHTVARGHLDEDEVFYTGKTGTNLVAAFPMPVTREVLLRGREQFEIYCAPCHGRTGEGNGMIPQRGYPLPPSYHIDRLRQAPVGHFFDVITHGYGVMYPYAARVEPADRWAIAAYIRVLQLSRDAKVSDVSPEMRSYLEAMK
jgi:hypothetical protein